MVCAMGEQTLAKTTDTRQSAIFIFISICLARLATTNMEKKYSSYVGSNLEENIRINYKDCSAKVRGSSETANSGATKGCLAYTNSQIWHLLFPLQLAK